MGPKTDGDLRIVARYYRDLRELCVEELHDVTPDSIRLLGACQHLRALTLGLEGFHPRGACAGIDGHALAAPRWHACCAMQ